MTHPRVLDEQDIQQRLASLELEQRRVDSLISGWTTPGLMDPHFTHIHANHADFDILPHSVASLRFDTQAIGSGTAFAVPTVQVPSGATWNHGFEIDTSNGEIHVVGLPSETVIGFVLWWQWAANATGERALQWNDNNGNAVRDFEFDPDANDETFLHVGHVRRLAVSDTFYRLQVWQDSGDDLNGDGLLVAYLIR